MKTEYHENLESKSTLESYRRKEVHFWQPPCSCGVELGKALSENSLPDEKREVHSWQPPCSCGISLEDAMIE